MENFNNYIDNVLMRNYPLESDSVSENMVQIGGQTDTINRPTGGFPPIYVCDEIDKQALIENEENKKREYSTNKTAVSIKKIMEKRRNATPFITT
ncbi:MAG: hypothetical protein Edafosvirus30_2 [Edafosvirus sp.]|uniref:Uncharacterized protein n=1 Tax=Edafosvirus sp. TaxID=2487765 RepID=A0A3G4ZXM4_9VIRU|nr:MAG: hypothetical protein Edafosvirus30_2 [Edafosvirus sp.]